MSTRAAAASAGAETPADRSLPTAEPTAAAAPAALRSVSSEVAGGRGTTAAAAGADDDDEALRIADAEGEEAEVLEVSAFADLDCVLTRVEEAPPHRLAADYVDALFNADPRVAFEVLHIGAMRTIEVCEGKSGSHADYPASYMPPVELVRHVRDGLAPFFTVPLMHPRVRAHPPLERCDHQVDELLARPSREALLSVIGADVMDRLRVAHAVQSAQRRRATARKAPRGS